MKLSDIKGESTFDVLAELVPPILSIASDDNASDLFKREPIPEGKNPREFALEKARKGIPALLRRHKDDLIDICAALHQAKREEYVDGLTLMSLTQDVFELISDEDFIGFLS